MNGRQIITLLTAGLSGAALTGCKGDPETLQQALDDLAKSDPWIFNSAMVSCYAPMMPDERAIDYVCPVCGHSTHYPEKTPGAALVSEMNHQLGDFSAEACARMKKFGVSLTVDDSELCEECRKKLPYAVKDPRRMWVVSRLDADGRTMPGSPWRVPAYTTDHAILEAFFLGKDTLHEGSDFESPLKDYLPRLLKILKP